MEAPVNGFAGIAHYLDARSTAIQWSPECRAPMKAEHLHYCRATKPPRAGPQSPLRCRGFGGNDGMFQ